MQRIFLVFCCILFGGWIHGIGNFERPLKIGGGGWLVGLDVNATDGQKIVRTDTYGGYIWTGSVWSQIVTQSSMPAANFGWVPTTGTSQVNQNVGGILEIASCPSNSAIVYMEYGTGIYKSINHAANWTKTTYAGGSTGNPNGTFRMDGRKMAVDPNNCDVVYAGTDGFGVFVTVDGGTNWTSLSPATIPTATASVNYNIAFDPSSGLTGGKTNTIYVHPNGSQTYVSTDAGATWNPTVGGPTGMQHMVVAPTGGFVWAIDNTGSSNGNLWKYVAGTWTQIVSVGTSWHSVAVDPANVAHVVIGGNGGALSVSADATTAATFTGIGPFTRVATDVPWLAWANETFMSSGDIQFDPSGSNLLIFSEGIGVWSTNPPSTAIAYNWTSFTAGIEQLVSQQIIAPNGIPIVGVQDRATFTLTNQNSYATQQTNPNYNSNSVFNQTFGLDWASSNSQFIVGLTTDYIFGNVNYSGYSSDGGVTFYPFNSYYKNVVAASVVNDGTGKVQINVDSTTGLSTWSAGSGTILRVVPYNRGSSTLNRYWYATVKSSTELVLQGSTYAAAMSTTGNYEVYVDTNPLTDYNAAWKIIGATNSGGLINIQINNTINPASFTPTCITGVVGTIEANGCWLIGTVVAGVGGTFTLLNSTFSNAYVSGGTATRIIPAGGYIAASTPLNIVMVPANNSYPQCTIDGGLTWTELRVPESSASFTASIATTVLTVTSVEGGIIKVGSTLNGVGVSTATITSLGSGVGGIGTYNISVSQTVGSAAMYTTGNTGYGSAYFFFWQRNAAADRVTPNKFYIYNDGGVTGSSAAGYYSFTNCGTPTLVANNAIASRGNNSVVRSVPGKAGHVFYTPGWITTPGHPGSTSLYISTDGGVTMTALPNVREVYTMDFGPVAPGAAYPTMYITGWVNNGDWTWGHWRSKDADQVSPTWELVAQYPLGSMDAPFAIAADGLDWAKFYVGFGGSGYGTIRKQNYLLKRDMNHDNDNTPAFLNVAA